MTSTIGIPIKLLNEAQVSPSSCTPPFRNPAKDNTLGRRVFANEILLQGHVVTLEITSGQVYRGKLLEGFCSPKPFPLFPRLKISP
jgi:hypothetical protein